jgi:outer membrane protein
MLAKISLVLNAILLILVINLYVQNCDTSSEAQVSETEIVNNDESLKIAYINTDSLDANYLYAQEIVNTLRDEMEKKQRRLERKAQKLQQEFDQLQQSARSMTPTQLQAAQQRAMQMEQEIQLMQNELANEFAEEQNDLQIELANDLDAFLLEYNSTANYDFIIRKHRSSELLLADETYDITEDVIEKINARYKGKESKKDSLP